MTDQPKKKQVIVEDSILNADWIKTRSWDIRNEDQSLVSTYEELCAFCERMNTRVEDFLKLPAARAMPATIEVPIDDGSASP